MGCTFVATGATVVVLVSGDTMGPTIPERGLVRGSWREEMYVSSTATRRRRLRASSVEVKACHSWEPRSQVRCAEVICAEVAFATTVGAGPGLDGFDHSLLAPAMRS
jgi:hypothetical protein